MVRSPCSGPARSLLFSVVFVASWGASRDAAAMGRYGMVPVDSAHASAPVSHDPALGHFPGDTAAQCGVVTYCGGPVLSSVQLVPVFWTNQVNPSITSWAPSYLQALADSSFLDMLSEYSTKGQTGEACGMETDAGLQYFGPSMPFSTNQTITRGTGLSAVTINPANPSGPITDDNAAIGLELASQIAKGNLPAPTYDAQGYPDTLYVVFFPSGFQINLMGMQSCGAFGGYHYSAPYTAQASCKGQYLPYAVIPDCGGGTPDITVSHEVAEAVTDTDVGPTTPMSANYGDGAWYLGPTYPCTDPSNCPSNCGEIGDVCESSGSSTVPPNNDITAQKVWSQQQNNCAVDNPGVSTQPSVPGNATCAGSPPPMPDAGGPTGSDAGTAADSGPGAPGGDAGGLGDDSGASSGGTGPGGDDASVGSSSGGSSGGGNPNFDAPATTTGCACTAAPAGDWTGPGGVGAMLGLALLGARRSRRRSSRARALTR